MAAAQPSSPAPSSPDLEGYDSALEEVNTPRLRIGDGGRGGDSVSCDDSNRTIRTPPQRVSLIGANQEPVRGVRVRYLRGTPAGGLRGAAAVRGPRTARPAADRGNPAA